ncbi:MAG: dynamin family protein [Desulfosarcinaceae bacterium]|nr:dynamin family protein [Desulfosarcinaceae bacterium]
MYRENYINALQDELLEIVAEQLTPVAMRWGYSEVPLEANIKWRPLVLILGNYSSGKSTLINELLGGEIQAAGQAPTDDSFTIITFDDATNSSKNVEVTEERDGKFLLHDSEYPFESLKKHGQRFAAHFRLKKVNSPFLKNLALIDTPGMLDSITERDRGYDYQEVIGDLAQIADLVLVLFDPHKAGTVREAHTSLRHTLPARTFEDRVIFVLNRIDECASMMDLLRVYGTLCWNLSQITGRKDIPLIHLTYSPKAAKANVSVDEDKQRYLAHLENQRDSLKKAILDAPCHRLDNLATFVETHSERLAHYLEALISFRGRTRRLFAKSFFSGLLIAAVCGGGAFFGMVTLPFLGGLDPAFHISGSSALAVGALFIWLSVFHRFFFNRYLRKQLQLIDDLTILENQTRRDSWKAVQDLVYNTLKRTAGRFSLGDAKRDFAEMQAVHDKGAIEIREALKELSTLSPDDEPPRIRKPEPELEPADIFPAPERYI